MKNEKKLTPLQAIRKKCLDCCCFSKNEVRHCTSEECPLYPFRLGKNPNRKLSDEAKEKLKSNLEKARAKKQNEQ